MLIEFLLALGSSSSIIYYIFQRFSKLKEEKYEIEKTQLIEKYDQKIIDTEKEGKIKAAKSLKRSKEVLRGQAYEQITPYLEEFKFYPGDCRFLGSPIDLVVFDGAVRDDIKKVVLVEIKTGKSRLNKRQQQIKKAVKDGKVEWLEYRVPTKPIKLEHKQDLAEIDECLCNDCVGI